MTDLIDRLPPRGRPPAHLAVDTFRQAGRDRITGMAAEIAFWVLLSLPPMLLATVAAAGVIGNRIGTDVRTRLIDRIGELATGVFSEQTVEAVITPTLDGLLTSGSPLLSLSFVVTIYSASRVFHIVVHAVAVAYGMEDPRPTWLSRFIGFVYTVTGLLLAIPLIPMLIAGPRLGDILERRFGLDVLALDEVWTVLYWPVSVALVAGMLTLIFHYASPWRTPFRRDVPGALLATVLALVINAGLRLYTGWAFDEDPVYASLGAPLAVLIWVWLQALAVLLGAELNAAIERADPVRDPSQSPRRLEALGRRATDEVKKLTSAKRR